MALDWRDWIEERPEVMLGKPVFKGTRLTVEHVLTTMAVSTAEELFEAYPRLRPEHLQAALLFAAETVHQAKPAKIPETLSAAV